MKILKKRAIAMSIDSFILGMILASLSYVLRDFSFENSLSFLLVFVSFFCRDFLFRNASLGKKIMRIVIYDNDWKPPIFLLLFVRSFLVWTIGYPLSKKSRIHDNSMIHIFDWERDKLGTRVIDKEVYRRLSEEAKEMKGDFAKNMTELYNAYLREIYIKK